MKRPTHAGRWCLVLCLIALVTSAVFAYKPLQINYHRQQMHLAWNALEKGQTVDIKLKWLAIFGLARLVKYSDAFDEHRDKLVELGYLEHEEFTCQYILEQSDEYRGMWSEMESHASRTAENYFESTSWDASRAAGPMRIKMWDTPARMAMWRRFIEEHDVPDFFDRFPDARVPASETPENAPATASEESN